MTCFTGQREVSHKLHLHCHGACALAFLTASPLRIKGEMGRCDIQLACQLLTAKQLTYGIISLKIRGRIGTRAFANGVLVHHLDVAYLAVVARYLVSSAGGI